MAIRVLGYKTVVEAKGTWPTNYIAKAQELKVLKDVKYKAYNDGAVRGNVALLIWNMLRTNMWDVNSESEKDGLNYSKAGTMINKYFDDYTYATATFTGFNITDGKVEMGVTAEYEENGKLFNLFKKDQYEYAGNDFYTFVLGEEVEVLVNEEDETLLTIVSTGADKLVDGLKKDINDDYDELKDNQNDYDYAYAIIKNKKVKESTRLKVVSDTYINDVDTSNKKYVKFNETNSLKFVYDDEEDNIYIKDGERVTVKDIKVGDILSKVAVQTEKTDEIIDKVPTFYVVSNSTIKGKLTKVVLDKEENETTATIGGNEYTVDGSAVYYEDPEEDNDYNNFTEGNFTTAMKGEVVEAKCDFLGRVVAVLFDGEINEGDDEEDIKVGFYAITSDVEGRYELSLENEKGKDTYQFADNHTGRQLLDENLKGTFSIVSFDKDSDIEDLTDYADGTFQLKANKSGKYDEVFENLPSELVYDKDGHKYIISKGLNASYDKDNKSITVGNESVKVNSDTVVVTLVYDDKGTKRLKDDECRVEFSEGTKAIEKLKGEPAVVITDGANRFAKAKYVVIFDEVSNKEENLVGIIANIEKNELGDWYITIADTRITSEKELAKAKKDARVLKDVSDAQAKDYRDNYQVVLYSLEENKDGEEEVVIERGITNDELKNSEINHAYIAKSDDSKNKNVSSDGREAVITLNADAPQEIKALLNGDKLDLDDEDVVDFFEDYKVVILDVETDTDEDDTEDQRYATGYKEVDYSKVELKELDRISIDSNNDVVTIIRGLGER